MRVAAHDVARVEALLELAGCAAVSFDDAEDNPVLEPPPGEAPLWPTVVVRALFAGDRDLAALARAIASDGTSVTLEPLANERWQAALLRAPAQRRIGARLWLGDARAAPPTTPGLAVVRLNMGLAFGTGEHPTTALCLEWLERHLKPGARVLDYGCGSGVLAIAALALGAEFAWAVDNDAQAIAATADNTRLNGRSERMWIGLPEALPAISADLVIANILAGALIDLAPTLRAHAAPDATLLLTGVLPSQSDAVIAAYAPFCRDFALTEREGWTLITGVAAADTR